MPQHCGPKPLRATIVIPQRNATLMTAQCLASLSAHETEPHRVLIVDDGSDLEERASLERLQADDRTVLHQKWSGVSAAWNRGARSVTTPYTLFLNNDTIVDAPILDLLINPLERGMALVTGAETRTERMLPLNCLEHLPTREFLAGWCFAISVDLLRRVGGFDETLRVYWSDTDLQARVLCAEQDKSSQLHAISGLAIQHLGHQTARRLVNRREIWMRDRERFPPKMEQNMNMTLNQSIVRFRCRQRQKNQEPVIAVTSRRVSFALLDQLQQLAGRKKVPYRFVVVAS